MTAFVEEAARLLRLAERDCESFLILGAHGASLAAACFHAQQPVEKAMKAVLTMRQLAFRRTHDLEELANLLTDASVELPVGLAAPNCENCPPTPSNCATTTGSSR